jgi:hypothetical protein
MCERHIWKTVLQYVYTLHPAKSTLNHTPGKVPIPGKSLKDRFRISGAEGQFRYDK